MPFAGVENEPIHFDLKTCPGGYVKIARMSYGQKLVRTEKSFKQTMTTKKGQKDQVIDVDMLLAQAKVMDFNRCVVDHNLTYMVNGNEMPLNFKDANILNNLNGKIAEEIDGYIDEVNNYEEDAEEMIAANAQAVEAGEPEGKDLSTLDS